MKRIDTPRAANVYQGAAGGSGHLQDTDVTGATQFDAEWCEGVQENICGIIEGLGGVLAGDHTDQAWALLEPKLWLTGALDTGWVSNTHLRGVAASTTSRASGACSAVVASLNSTATGARSFVGGSGGGDATGDNTGILGGEGQLVDGDDSAAVAGANTVVTGDRAAIIGGKNCRIVEDDTVAFGDSGAPPGAGPTNNGITAKIQTVAGDIVGTNLVAGDPNLVGVGGAQFTVRGSDGGITVVAGLVGSNLPYEIHDTGPVAIPAGAKMTVICLNSSAAAASIPLWSVKARNLTNPPPAVANDIIMGTATTNPGVNASFTIWNNSAGALACDIVISFVLINPV